ANGAQRLDRVSAPPHVDGLFPRRLPPAIAAREAERAALPRCVLDAPGRAEVGPLGARPGIAAAGGVPPEGEAGEGGGSQEQRDCTSPGSDDLASEHGQKTGRISRRADAPPVGSLPDRARQFTKGEAPRRCAVSGGSSAVARASKAP